MKYTHRLTSYYGEEEIFGGVCLTCRAPFIYQGDIPNYCPECGAAFNNLFNKRNPRYQLKVTIKEYPYFLIEYTIKQVKGEDFYSDFLSEFISKKNEWLTYNRILVERTGSAVSIIKSAKNLIDGDHYKSVRISLVKSKGKSDIVYKWDSKNPVITRKNIKLQASGLSQCSG